MTSGAGGLAVVASRLNGVVDAMMTTLFRASRSGVINTARDFSCCIVSPEHELVVAGDSLPIHVMSGPELVTPVMSEFHAPLRPGDAFLNNSPYHGNSHAADYTILVPVFDEHERHRFTVLAKAHMADCGNSAPTTYHAAARDVYEEGALLFPCVRIQEGYEYVEDLLRMCRVRMRVPTLWSGDFAALMGAARTGERRLSILGADVGWDELAGRCSDWLKYSDATMARALGRLPVGASTVTTTHDPFPGVPDGIALRCTVTTHPADGRVTIDLRDNPDQQPCGLNLSEATARTAALIGVFNSIEHTVPKNAGSFGRVEILLREGSVAGIPVHPASCSVATTNVADRVLNCVQRAFAELGDGLGMAAGAFGGSSAAADLSGTDVRTGLPFMNEILLAQSCGAAGPSADGWLTTVHPGNGGMLRLDSVELDELRFPIIVEQQRVEPDTAGAGRYCGAPGIRVEYRADSPLEVMFASDGTVHPAEGAREGKDGAPARQWVRRRDGSLEELPGCCRISVERGESLIGVSGAGGGYGPACERDRAAVRRDLERGWLTQEHADIQYGVARMIDPYTPAVALRDAIRARIGVQAPIQRKESRFERTRDHIRD